jgi:hypothetical protein
MHVCICMYVGMYVCRYVCICMYVCVCMYVRMYVCMYKPIPVAARSKAWVCGRSLAGIVGSNTAGGMDVCLL